MRNVRYAELAATTRIATDPRPEFLFYLDNDNHRHRLL